MKLLLSLLLSACTFSMSVAQTALDDIRKDPCKSGGVYYAYPVPSQKTVSAPAGYQPFYISHYGRHGSRYMLNDFDYLMPLTILRKADEQNALTPLGKDAYQRMEEIWKEAEFHGDELAPLGKRQHRGIAERMYNAYPEIFAGEANVTARSTTSMRVALSMMAFCERLKELNPRMNLDWETSRKNMSYLNYHTERYDKIKKDPDKWKKDHDTFCARGVDPSRFISQIFADSTFFSREKMPAWRFFNSMFDVAIDLQDMETDISLYDLFTAEELYELWRNGNSWFYLCDADSPLNEGSAIESTRPLLANIIEQADLAIAGKGDAATLRFGHDGNIIPLCAIMHLEGCDASETNHDIIDEKWQNYRVSPMGANVQLVFYRKKKGDDVIVKILHNEVETTIPVASDILPFYHWKDVRSFFMKQLEQ